MEDGHRRPRNSLVTPHCRRCAQRPAQRLAEGALLCHSCLRGLDFPPGFVGTPWFGLAAAAIFAGFYIFFNYGLFRLIGKRGGARALFAGITLHWLYHVYASAIFAAVQLMAKMRNVLAAVRRMLVDKLNPLRVPTV